MVSLTGAYAPTRRGIGANAITITATGNLILDSDINTSGNVVLTAGEGADNSGAINFSTAKPVSVRGDNITLNAVCGADCERAGYYDRRDYNIAPKKQRLIAAAVISH